VGTILPEVEGAVGERIPSSLISVGLLAALGISQNS
jgi:hypothetical protein